MVKMSSFTLPTRYLLFIKKHNIVPLELILYLQQWFGRTLTFKPYKLNTSKCLALPIKLLKLLFTVIGIILKTYS